MGEPRELPPNVKVTRYSANVVPETVIGWYAFGITAECVGRDRWAVRQYSQCLGRNGEWDWEPLPSSRSDDWLTEHRFSEAEAIERIATIAPDVMVNGNRASDVATRPGPVSERE